MQIDPLHSSPRLDNGNQNVAAVGRSVMNADGELHVPCAECRCAVPSCNDVAFEWRVAMSSGEWLWRKECRVPSGERQC